MSSRQLRILMHDYSGHPFQVELSRELARRGHKVLHQFSADYVTGHGNLEVRAGDPETFTVHALDAGAEFRKYDLLGRMRFELSYARSLSRHLRNGPPFDVVVACNVPLFALAYMRASFSRRSVRWVLWHQDVYSRAVGDEITRRLPRPLALPLRRFVEGLEKVQVRSAEHIVAISDAFVQQYRSWGLATDRVSVIPNWAPLHDISPRPRENDWTRRNALPSTSLRLLYAGTLGRKHNPLLLLTLQNYLREKGVDSSLIVCSEGVGADQLADASGGRGDVRFFGFQPAAALADMLGAADVTIALLETDAALFSVPSKVLSYLAAGRPIVLLAPSDNPAADDVRAAGGFVAAPTKEGAEAAARWLSAVAAEPGRLAELAASARRYAEERFDVDIIAGRFEQLLRAAADGRP